MRRRHVGPLLVQRPFHPEGDGATHVYLLHPPGGIAGGDKLEITCHLGAGSRVLLTTPGATKFYRSAGGRSVQRMMINVGAGAVCEYLPQETIVFNGAAAHIETRVRLASTEATYVGWDFVSLGRPAASEFFTSGAIRQRVEVLLGERPIWFERLSLDGASSLGGATFAFKSKPIVGTMIYIGPFARDAAERVRDSLGEGVRSVFSVSQLEHGIVCRYLGEKMSEGKSVFVRAWDVLRDAGQGKRAVMPRIWAT